MQNRASLFISDSPVFFVEIKSSRHQVAIATVGVYGAYLLRMSRDHGSASLRDDSLNHNAGRWRVLYCSTHSDNYWRSRSNFLFHHEWNSRHHI